MDMIDQEEFDRIHRFVGELFNLENDVLSQKTRVSNLIKTFTEHVASGQYRKAIDLMRDMKNDFERAATVEQRLKDTHALRERLRNYLLVNKLDDGCGKPSP